MASPKKRGLTNGSRVAGVRRTVKLSSRSSAYLSNGSIKGRQYVSNDRGARHPAQTTTERVGGGDLSWRDVRGVKTIPYAQTSEALDPVVTLKGVAAEATMRLVQALLRRAGTLDLAAAEKANGSMDAVVERMLASVPGANVLDDAIGPFYDTAGLRKWFGISRQALDAQGKNGDVLCVLSSDDHRLYPSFQFNSEGQPLPRLREVLAGLDPDRDDAWGDAMWLNDEADELDGMTPAAALRTDRADEVVRLAAQAGAFLEG